jgi:anti-sigma regulatory factor (Ser/Thr protein kinase)
MENSRTDPILNIDIPSNQRCVAEILSGVKEFVRERSDRECSDLLLVLRELLMNAIVHGNGCSEEHRVKAAVHSLGNERFSIVVEDEGNGFDYHNLLMETERDQGNISRCGYVLVKSLSQEIRFNDNGNRVSVVIALDGGRGNGHEEC